MSYLSRVYRERNTHLHDEGKKQSFFSSRHDIKEPKQRNAFFQAKLSINEPGDSYEKEADSIATSVVNKSVPMAAEQNKIQSIQRLATAPEEEKVSTNDERMERDKEKPFQVQKKNNGEDKLKEEDKMKMSMAVQKKNDGNTRTASPHVSAKIANSVGKGNKLPAKTLHEMNASFGTDFTNVRIHHDCESEALNKELKAQAFTHGNDIFFNSGKFNPENSDGRFLLAHELTHIIQQKGIENSAIQRSCNDGDCKTCAGGIRDFWITFYFRRKATKRTMDYLRGQINDAKTVLANCCLRLKADFNWTLLGGGGTFNFMNANPDGSWHYSADASALGSGRTFSGSRGIPVLIVDDVPASGGGVTVDSRFDTNYPGRTYAVIGVNQTNPNPGCNHLAHELWHVSSGIVGHDAAHGTLAACTGNTVSPEYCSGLRNMVNPAGDFPSPKKNTAMA